MTADITCLVAINQSANVAAGLADGRVVVWNGRDKSPAIELKLHTARVLAVGATADGQSVVSVAADGSLARTTIAAGAKSATRRIDLGPSPTRAAAFSTDGQLLATGNGLGEIRLFEAASGTLKRQWSAHRTELQDLAIRSSPPQLATAGSDADLRVWDLTNGQQLGNVDGDLSRFAVAFSPRDGTLASGGADRRLTLHDQQTFAAARVLELTAPKILASLAWSPDGRRIAIGDIDDASLSKGGIQVIDASTSAAVATLDTGGIPAGRLVFLAEGSGVVASVERDLRVWTLTAGS
jgi:WD40 repeat protein